MSPQTEVLRASELQERVIDRICDLRNPDVFPNYRKELATYKRRLGKREEAVFEGKGALRLDRSKHVGFMVTHLGQKVFVERPSGLRRNSRKREALSRL